MASVQISLDLFAVTLTGGYIDKARNVVIVGACGTGKSYIANALASDACRKLHKTLYCRMFELISDIKHMETQRLKRRYVNPDVLVIDDFANTKMTEEDQRLKRMVSV